MRIMDNEEEKEPVKKKGFRHCMPTDMSARKSEVNTDNKSMNRKMNRNEGMVYEDLDQAKNSDIQPKSEVQIVVENE